MKKNKNQLLTSVYNVVVPIDGNSFEVVGYLLSPPIVGQTVYKGKEKLKVKQVEILTVVVGRVE